MKRKLFEKHPIESEAKGVDIAFAGVGLFENELRGRSLEGADCSVIVKILLLFKKLLTQPKISDF